MKRRDERVIRVELFDGRASANVWIEDGYGRAVSKIYNVYPVRTREEAIAAAREDGLDETI